MKFRNTKQFNHQQEDRVAVLITNLGTPQAPTARALRPYLKQFLSDPRVVEFPRWLWCLILNGIILRVRPRRSAKSYASVWTQEGSPLLIHTQAQAEALAKGLQDKNIIVDFAMRYGEPAIDKVLQKLQDLGVRKLLVLPLYPQYCAATTASTFDALAEDFRQRRWIPELRFITQYHDTEPYIQAAAAHIQAYWKQRGRADKLIFSYHGIPKRYLLNGDPYHCQCYKTSRLIAEALGLQKDDYLTTFQSRFGREEWLQPYTDMTLKKLPEMGIKSVQIFCPGFAADCLETIEEIGVENRHYFLDSGGENYEYIPALNAEPVHVEALLKLIEANLGGWVLSSKESLNDRLERAKQLGATE